MSEHERDEAAPAPWKALNPVHCPAPLGVIGCDMLREVDSVPTQDFKAEMLITHSLGRGGHKKWGFKS